ncbi:hypothetical protein [Chryseobacterium populi]|uniref:Outer membrane protein beta-barrel domain-containing protein n=1 Tax=Chryseobacterium populi TaxID=1144316 RepID=J2SXY5_9FLAO|nr:hypothetical protein [Chryseobacterium populi]EJL70502.1 hypothetical protein PMI13_02837 [Chryseobacterium populi]
MNNKALFSAVLLTVSVMAFAQEKSGNYYDSRSKETLLQKISHYTRKIDSIVTSERTKMNDELDVVDRNFKDGKMSAADKQKLNNEIALKYESIINEKVDGEKESFEEITKERVRKSVLGKSVDEKKNDMKNLLNNAGILIGGGFLNLTSSSAPFNFFNESDEIRFGKSGSLSYQFRFEMQVGKYSSPTFLNFGIGVRADVYYLEKSKVFTQADGKLFQTEFTPGGIKYSQLKAEYIEVPLEMQFVLNPKYVDYGGEKFIDDSKAQLRIGVGIYGGVKIGSRIKYRYEDEVSNRNIFKQRVENGMNNFLFGTKLSIGYAGISLYVKKDLTSVFNDDAIMNNKNSLQIGIEIFNLTF